MNFLFCILYILVLGDNNISDIVKAVVSTSQSISALWLNLDPTLKNLLRREYYDSREKGLSMTMNVIDELVHSSNRYFLPSNNSHLVVNLVMGLLETAPWEQLNNNRNTPDSSDNSNNFQSQSHAENSTKDSGTENVDLSSELRQEVPESELVPSYEQDRSDPAKDLLKNEQTENESATQG